MFDRFVLRGGGHIHTDTYTHYKTIIHHAFYVHFSASNHVNLVARVIRTSFGTILIQRYPLIRFVQSILSLSHDS